MRPRPNLDTQTRILEAAARELSEKSAQFVQLKDVAAAANVSPSLILHHYSSKEDLFLEALLHRWRTVGVPETTAWLAANRGCSLEKIIAYYYTRDMRLSHTTKDFMSRAWWWSAPDEVAFQRLLETRDAAIEEALKRELCNGRELEEPLKELIEILQMIYQGVLRTALINNLNADEAAGHVMRAFKPILGRYREESSPKEG